MTEGDDDDETTVTVYDTFEHNISDDQENQTQRKKGKRGKDDDFIDLLKMKVVEEKIQPNLETDEDKLFLLSLVSELRKVPADRKLKVKGNIIYVISTGQLPPQPRWPHSRPHYNQHYLYHARQHPPHFKGNPHHAAAQNKTLSSNRPSTRCVTSPGSSSNSSYSSNEMFEFGLQ